MTRRLIIPILLLSLAFISHGAQQQNAAQVLQQTIQNTYDSGGGIVPFKGQISATDPIYVYSCITLRGESPHRDALNSTAKISIVVTNAKGNTSGPQQVSIEGIGIKNPNGGGVALSDYVRTNTASYDLNFQDLEIDTAGMGIEIEHTGKDAYGQALVSQRPHLRNVRIIANGGGGAKINGVGTVVESGCTFNTRKTGGKPGLWLKGQGSLRDSVIHDKWGSPALQISGPYRVDSMYVESVSQILLDGAEVEADTASWFRQPNQQCVLINGSRLVVSGRLAYTDNGGGSQTTADQCYRVDGTSAVTRGSSVLLGKASVVGPTN